MKEDELIEFRKLWITDICSSPKISDLHGQSALQLWVKGYEMEKRNNSVEAIKLYRMAIRLDPDIEKKYLESEIRTLNPVEVVLEEQAKELPSLEMKADRLDQNSAFLLLPPEIHVQILKFLSVLDINGIFQISLSCKQMSQCILKESIWRFACNFYHDVDVDVEVSNFQNSFLEMWINKPRIRYDGIYVSTIKYQREGMSDPSLRLANLKTVHVVTYHRLKRFYPDHTVLIFTTSRDPREVSHLFTKSSKLKGCFSGKWRWAGENIIVDWNGVKNNTRLSATLKIFSTIRGLQNRLYWINLVEHDAFSTFAFPKSQLDTFEFIVNDKLF